MQLIMTIVVISFNSAFLDRAVQSLDPAVGPRVVGLRQPMLHPVGAANHVKAHWLPISGIAIVQLFRQLDTIVT